MPRRKDRLAEDQKIIQFKKSNQLVEGRYKFDIWETRIFFKMLSLINNEKDETIQERKIRISDLIEDFDVKRDKRAYQRFYEGAEKLRSKPIEVYLPNTKEVLRTSLITGIKTPIEGDDLPLKDQYITVSFHNDLKDFLLKVKSNFTELDFANLSKLPSSYSIRVYELLKRYHDTGWREDTVENLKKMLGVIEQIQVDKKKTDEQLHSQYENIINVITIKSQKYIEIDNYPRFANFNQRVIKKAQKDLAKYTDISFTYETKKRGRVVHSVRFNFQKKSSQDKRKKLPTGAFREDAAQKALFEKIYPEMKDWENITESGLKKALSSYSENQVLAAFTQTKNDSEQKKLSANPIRSRGKYFFKLVRVPTLFDEVSASGEASRIKEEGRKRAEKQQEEILSSRNKKRKELFELEQELVKKLLVKQPEMREKAIANALKKPIHQGKDRSSLEGNTMFEVTVHNEVKKLVPAEFEPLYASFEEDLVNR